MKNLLTFLLLFLALTAFPGKRYWIGGGSTTGWNASPNTNWAATSGGTVRVAAPTSSDSVYFDGAGANGNSVSIINANYIVKLYIVSASYTSTVNHSGYLSVAGDITLHSGFTMSGPVALQSSGGGTITTGGKSLVNFNFITSTATRTIVGNMTVTGTLQFGVSGLVLNASSNETLTSTGTMNILGNVTGTLKIIKSGGFWTGGASVYLGLNTDIAGDITMGAGGCAFGGTATLTYVSGTISQNVNSFLALLGTPTLDIDGVTWLKILVNSTTVTAILAAPLTATTISITGSSTATIAFAGSYGFITDELIIDNITNLTFTLQDGITYEVNNSFSCYKSRVGAIVTVTSNHATNKAILFIHHEASCNILASFTRIDASSGRYLSTFNGTVTDCSNISECHDCYGYTIGG